MKISELINTLEKLRDEHDGDVKVLVEENYLDSFRYAGSNKKALEDHGYADATRKDLSFKQGRLVLKSSAVQR